MWRFNLRSNRPSVWQLARQGMMVAILVLIGVIILSGTILGVLARYLVHALAIN